MIVAKSAFTILMAGSSTNVTLKRTVKSNYHAS